MSYGSPLNQAMTGANQTLEPEVGMGATMLGWTDRHPYTVIEILSPRRIVLQQDIAVRTDRNGVSESQKYSIHPDSQGSKVVVTKRKNGRWVEQGETSKGTAYVIGYRSKYHDYSF